MRNYKSYQYLRQQMEAFRARHDEAKFFFLERRSWESSKEIETTEFALSKLYLWFSKYGTSILRPVSAMGIGTLVFILYYAIAIDDWLPALLHHKWPEVYSGLRDATEFGLEAIFLPFRFWLEDPSEVTLKLKLVASFQSVFSLTMLTFVVLALRWRFRRG